MERSHDVKPRRAGTIFESVEIQMKTSNHSSPRGALKDIPADSYAVIFTNTNLDRYKHNVTFAEELTPALRSSGVDVRYLDYIHDIRGVSEALKDPSCVFFICFNGFGSELLLSAAPGEILSAFANYRKPLFDLMHDCPIHESMAHQINSVGEYRRLMLTDYSYANLARLLGMRRVRFVPSISFPKTSAQTNTPLEQRSIDFLLPAGLSMARYTRERYASPSSYKGRIFKEIFECVTERAVEDLRIDPLQESFFAFQELQIPPDLRDPDFQFLVTSILDYVKFARREKLLEAIKHLPITVISNEGAEDAYRKTRLKFIAEQNFPDLVRTMGNSKAVICPLPHYTGFHERALAAFSAGSVVIAAPNDVLEATFIRGRDMYSYGDVGSLTSLLEEIVKGGSELQDMAQSGRAKALDQFSPTRIVDIILSDFLSKD
jgi:glycosyltransferase involved in cell wall biosynthesis